MNNRKEKINPRFRLGIKLFVLSFVMLVLVVALAFVGSLVSERQYAQKDVVRAIAESTSGSQKIVGPIISIPYEYTASEYIYAKNDNGEVTDKVTGSRDVRRSGTLTVLPKELQVTGSTDVEARKLGIYQSQLFNAKLRFLGKMNAIDLSAVSGRKDFKIGTPVATVLVGDSRGIQSLSTFSLNGHKYDFKPGSGIGNHSGIHAAVNLDQTGSNDMMFAFDLTLQGTESLSVVPVGEKTSFNLSSNWADPSFIGNFLPSKRSINEKGFNATWESTWFANGMNEKIQTAQGIETGNLDAFSVNFIKTVDQYQLNTRSVKYGFLFIALTFVTFFVFEILKSLRVHPIQYFMIGGALVLFYVLLLALSEQLGFNLSYLIAAVLCVALITFYSSYALGGIKGAAVIGVLLSSLYGVLFVILQTEDFALLAGSMLLFAVLAAVMFATRKIDWYGTFEIKKGE